MMGKSILLVCSLATLGAVLCMSSLDAALISSSNESNLPIGSPSWCIDKLQSPNLHHFEVLPGAGWDNLENKARGQVIKRTYYQCRTTDDGKFLLPDGVITTPVKSSTLNVFSKIYSSWMHFKDTTSESINVAADFKNEFFSIDGMFSTETQTVKENQLGRNTSIVRTQARYVRYTSNLQPDTPLHPTFKARVMEIAKSIQTNESDVARYESQQLVRDFGTHVLTGLDAGAVIAKIQLVNSNFVKNNDEKTTRRMASLCTSFSFNPKDVNSSFSEQQLKEFTNSVEYSTIKTYGGPSYQPDTFKLDTWAEGLDDNLVAVDKEGTPLYFFITASAFPELPNYIVPDVFNNIYQAVYLYYKFNTYRGCTDANKPNFNRRANVDDGTCTPPSTNFTFGGVYQTCTQDSFLKPDHCSEYIKKNPLTSDMTCPPGYSSVLLDNSYIAKTDTTRECHKVWYKLWIGQKCTDVPVSGSLYVKSYWCGATGNVQQRSGYMFGGLYTPNVVNPMTGSSTCPPNFYGQKLNDGLTICVTQDFNAGFTYAAPFGGFFTCSTGNPLATIGKTTDPTLWSKSCPVGFSNHLALVSNNCEIEYCAVTRKIDDNGLPSLRKPPFMTYPGYRNTETTEIFIDTNSNTWTKVPSNNLKVHDATLDLETAKLVFRNNPDFEEQMQLIDIPAMQMTYENISSENNNLKPAINGASTNEETTIKRENAQIRRLHAESSPDLENSPASMEHHTLPNGMVAALSVVSTLLCVCIIALAVMYRRRKERRSGGEAQTLLS